MERYGVGWAELTTELMGWLVKGGKPTKPVITRVTRQLRGRKRSPFVIKYTYESSWDDDFPRYEGNQPWSG